MRYNLDRSFYIHKEAKVIAEKGAAIVYGEEKNGRFTGMAFYGKAQKPTWNFWFKTVEQRQAYVNRWLESMNQHEAFIQERKQARKVEISQAEIRPGDYFSTSWGYDQTNYDFLVVVSVTRCQTICKMAAPIVLGESGQTDVLMPGQAYGRTFRMKISGKDTLCGQYPFCHNDNQDSLRMGYFSKTTLGQVHYQTMPEFGH